MIMSRGLRRAGHVARTGEKSNAYRIVEGKTGGNTPLARSRHRWKDNNKMDLG
jgi:hypothetical protein